jgi:hypothetical protein
MTPEVSGRRPHNRTLARLPATGAGVKRVEVTGSLRRRQDTVGDIDMLAVRSRSRPVMEHFLACPQARRTERAGTTRATIILHSGLQVDLRIVSPRSYGAAGSSPPTSLIRTRGRSCGAGCNDKNGSYTLPEPNNQPTINSG